MNQTTVKQILSELGIADAKITESALLKKDLELDSTETVQIAIELKKRLDVDVKFESREDLTVGALCALVDRLTAAKAAHA